MKNPPLGRGELDRRSGSTSRQTQRGATAPGRSTRRTVAAVLTPLLATAGLTGIASSADAAVTVGTNVSVFPNRDMVVAVGYQPGEELTIEVLRGGVVIGTTTGPAVDTPEGVGLEVNHGPLGTPQPGDCWDGFTPDIVGGDVIRVTSQAGVDTMTVADVDFVGGTYLGEDDPATTVNEGNDVKVDVTGAAADGAAVEFRRDKPAPRFRRGPFDPKATADPAIFTASFRPSTGTSAEGLTPTQQRNIALNEAAWLAVVDNISETTLAELGEPGGVGAGCTGTADPNTVVGGLEPVNIASGDIVISGTAKETVTGVSIKVGALGLKDATLSTNPTGVKTWSVPVTKAELSTLPDGNITVTSSFDGLAGPTRTIIKDTVAPGVPTPTPTPGTYSTTQNVTLNKPAGDLQSKVYYEIGPAATVAAPDAASTPYTTQIAVSSTQTIKARAIDPAGNLGAVGTFDYTIQNATVAPAPTGVTAEAGDASAVVAWTPAAGDGGAPVTSWRVQVFQGTSTTPLRTVSVDAPDQTLNPGELSAQIGTLTNGTSYRFRVAAFNGVAGTLQYSALSAAVTPRPANTAPDAPTGVSATAGNAQATVSWTAPTNNGGSAITGYVVDTYQGTALVKSTAFPTTATSQVVGALTNGTAYTFRVRAVNAIGQSVLSGASAAVTPVASTPVTAPGAPTNVTATAGDTAATVNWTAPTNTGGAAITEYRVQVRNSANTVLRTVQGIPGTASSTVVTGLTNGTAYNFRVRALNSGTTTLGTLSAASNSVTPQATTTTTVPGAPTIGTAGAGAAGGTITATARWTAPTDTGGTAITGYVVRWQRLSSTNTVLASGTVNAAAGATSLSPTLPVTGRYRFAVRARNAVGVGIFSANSNIVTGQ
jgi:hypothetical protein